jgi:hypothetical protein
MADKVPSLSTYQYAFDNPTLMNDPAGLMPQKMNPEFNPVVTSGGGFDDGTGTMNAVMSAWTSEGFGPDSFFGGGSGGPLNAAGSPGTLIYMAGAAGDLGSFAAAYISLGNMMGQHISNTDTYLAAMIFNAAWSGQVSNVTASLLPNSDFQINGTTKAGNALYNYQVGSDYVSSYLSRMSGYEVESNGGEESNGLEMARTTLDAGILAQDLTINGVTGAQRLANAMSGTSNSILNLDKLSLLKVGNLGSISVEAAGKTLGFAAVALTGADIYNNGLNWSNGTDLAFDGIAFIPVVGWAISGAYFIANEAVKYETGQSIGQHIGNTVNSAPPLDFDTGGGYEGTVP